VRAGALAVALMLAAASARADDSVTVHVRGDAGASFQRQVVAPDHQLDWKTLCVSPCTTMVSPNATLRVGASRFSAPFGLPTRQDVALRVTLPPSRRGIGSDVLVDLAIAAFLGGALSITCGVAADAGSVQTDATSANVAIAIGVGGTIAGAVMLTAGLLLRRSSIAKVIVLSASALRLSF
jgi:hypothetical protein